MKEIEFQFTSLIRFVVGKMKGSEVISSYQFYLLSNFACEISYEKLKAIELC